MTARDAGADGRPAGRLWVVATPLGNLGDITARAREAIAECDLVACEDTRVTGGLLRHLDVSKPMLAYHEHNEKDAAVLIADKVAGGARIALITDAGTPGISDPGFRVTRECRRRGLTVTPLPGPCAIVALLSASGLPTNAFRFVGFLAPKSAAWKPSRRRTRPSCCTNPATASGTSWTRCWRSSARPGSSASAASSPSCTRPSAPRRSPNWSLP
jgi:16S rRNA C1402 (ribose-2'-O) methylase RsmI